MPTAPPAPAGTRSATSARPVPRALLVTCLVLALLGLAIAVELWLVHVKAHSGGGPSFCDVDEHVSCSDVARSSWSSLLGVPLAAWGALAYLAAAALSATGLRRREHGSSWPAGLLLVLTALMSATGLALAAISELVLKKLCLLCAASWVVSFALLVLSIALVRRAGGAGAALRADRAALRTRPLALGAALVALAVVAMGLIATHAGQPALPVPPPGPTGAAAIPPGPPGSLVVYEYSDYLCPFCARMHADEPQLLSRRPDLRLVRRHFPLDSACNPRIKTKMHEGSCDLARGAICAEAQGRFEAYDDAAFRGQEEALKPEELARRAGLDLAAFGACLRAPATEARLAGDVQSGIAAGIRGTPSFLVQGKLRSAAEFLSLLGQPATVAGP